MYPCVIAIIGDPVVIRGTEVIELENVVDEEHPFPLESGDKVCCDMDDEAKIQVADNGIEVVEGGQIFQVIYEPTTQRYYYYHRR